MSETTSSATRRELRRERIPGTRAQARGGIQKQSADERQLIALPNRFVPRFWEQSDMRIAVVRSIKGRYEQIKRDAGGSESVQRDLLCQRVAFFSVILETFEVRAAEGAGIDLGVYTQATNALIGLLKTLGLDKRIKSVNDLQSYLKSK